MKKQYYGLSMGLIEQADRPTDHTAESNYFVYIMKNLIKEFNLVGADFLILNKNLEQLGDFVNEIAVEGYVVFSFPKEEYFSDILKTAELVIGDFANELVGIPDTSKERAESAITKANLKMCFRPYCVVKTVPNGRSKQRIVDTVLGELKELISRGRGIPLATKPSIVNILKNNNLGSHLK